MKIAIPRETHPGELRVSMVPANVERLAQRGARIEVEGGLGRTIGIDDEEYQKAGAKTNPDRGALLADADMVLRLRKPPAEEIPLMKPGCIHVSHLDPFRERELLEQLAAQDVSAVCMEMIPRTTLAQKMDALSSQANLAGYVSIIVAAERIKKILPMMMTPAGTIAPARVFIIGAGVAGLQAIATAKRLGARVEAFDTRPVVAEQVESLGAKFVKVDLGETGQTKDGYAKELTAEQLDKQREAMAKHCAMADIVVTTAQVFGRPAPRIVTADMVRGMRPGSVIVDMAVETGGNVEGSIPDQEVETNGVTIIGISNLPGRVAVNASQMYSANISNFIEHFWNKETKTFELQLDDDIIKGALVTHAGQIVNERLKART